MEHRLELPPTGTVRRPRNPFEPTTKRVRRRLLEGVASSDPDQVVAMVAHARRRGIPYERIRAWLGPRVSCPASLRHILDRLELLASIEG